VHPELVEQGPSLVGVHLGRLGLDRGVDADRSLGKLGRGLRSLLEVREDHLRLERQRSDRLQLAALLFRQAGVAERGLARQRGVRLRQRVDLGRRSSARPLRRAFQGRFEDGLVRKEEFGADLRELACGLRFGAEAAQDDGERVGLAELGDPLSARRASGDVHETDLRVDGLA
jgi:hypothetical protein